MTEQLEYFDFGKWWGKTIFGAYETKEIVSYLNDKDAIALHLKKLDEQHKILFPEEVLVKETQTIKLRLDHYHNSFCYESQRYINSKIVYLFTVFENLLEESSYLFLRKNHLLIRRLEQLNADFKINNFINLENLTNLEKTDDVLKNICQNAVKYIIAGKIEKSLNRINNLFEISLSSDSIKFFQKFQDIRNEIVHEIIIKTNDIEFFDDIANNIENVLDKLEYRFRELDIPYHKQYE